MIDEATAARFWTRVNKGEGTDACWIWLGPRNGSGYGQASIGNLKGLAHRIAYELTKGSIPAGMVLLHRCDNPPCVNPAHLTPGTRGDNNRDTYQKGRGAYSPGSPSWLEWQERKREHKAWLDQQRALRKR